MAERQVTEVVHERAAAGVGLPSAPPPGQPMTFSAYSRPLGAMRNIFSAGVIRDSAHQALQDLHEVIGVLREGGADECGGRPDGAFQDEKRDCVESSEDDYPLGHPPDHLQLDHFCRALSLEACSSCSMRWAL